MLECTNRAIGTNMANVSRQLRKQIHTPYSIRSKKSPRVAYTRDACHAAD